MELNTEVDHKSFLLYKDKYELVRSCTDEEAGILFKAIYEYAVTGEIRDLDNNLLNGILKMFCEIINTDNVKYMNRCRVNRVNGKKGGRPRKQKKPNGYADKPNANQIKAKKADTENDTDTDTDRYKARPRMYSNQFNDFRQNSYDFDNLEADLLDS